MLHRSLFIITQFWFIEHSGVIHVLSKMGTLSNRGIKDIKGGVDSDRRTETKEKTEEEK